MFFKTFSIQCLTWHNQICVFTTGQGAAESGLRYCKIYVGTFIRKDMAAVFCVLPVSGSKSVQLAMTFLLHLPSHSRLNSRLYTYMTFNESCFTWKRICVCLFLRIKLPLYD